MKAANSSNASNLLNSMLLIGGL